MTFNVVVLVSGRDTREGTRRPMANDTYGDGGDVVRGGAAERIPAYHGTAKNTVGGRCRLECAALPGGRKAAGVTTRGQADNTPRSHQKSHPFRSVIGWVHSAFFRRSGPDVPIF